MKFLERNIKKYLFYSPLNSSWHPFPTVPSCACDTSDAMGDAIPANSPKNNINYLKMLAKIIWTLLKNHNNKIWEIPLPEHKFWQIKLKFLLVFFGFFALLCCYAARQANAMK